MEEPYLIFSDESGYIGSHRFRSVCTVSGSKSNLKELNEKLKSILDQHSKSEIKFTNISSHSSTQNCATEFYGNALEFCSKRKRKIYVITWDTHDSRHDIQGRDDIENLKIMYYQILKLTMQHWGNRTSWQFYPDQQNQIDWQEIVNYLQNTNLSKKREWEKDLFGLVRLLSLPTIDKHKELESHKFPVIQIADLFAGAVRFTHEHGATLKQWISKEKSQNSLFPMDDEIEAPKKLLAKLKVLSNFKEKSGQLKLGINLSSNNYFDTFNKKNNIVFWKYDPQGDYDKAPVKNK